MAFDFVEFEPPGFGPFLLQTTPHKAPLLMTLITHKGGPDNTNKQMFYLQSA